MNLENFPECGTPINDLLFMLGITPRYVGFYHTSYAVYLVSQQPDRLLLITKRLYPEVAKRYQTSWHNVERSIRSAAEIAWKLRPDRLQMIVRRQLQHRPSNTQFISALALYLKENSGSGVF